MKPSERPTRLAVGDVMTRDVVTVASDTPFKEIAQLMESRGVSALPVVDELGGTVGVVSEADLLPKQEHAGGRVYPWERRERARAGGLTAGELMTSPAITVSLDMPLARVARLMRLRRVKRLPVVDEQGRLVGIVSRGDVLRVFTREDEEIRLDIVDGVIVHWMWLDAAGIDVSVGDGIVRLTGTVERRSEAETLGHLVRAVDGVVAVENQLGWRIDDRELAAAAKRGFGA